MNNNNRKSGLPSFLGFIIFAIVAVGVPILVRNSPWAANLPWVILAISIIALVVVFFNAWLKRRSKR